jgi:O-antigen/teichoic acid export membrane protein
MNRWSVIKYVSENFPFFRKNFDGHMIEVVRGASVVLMLRVMSVCLTLAFNVLLARLLGVDGVGVYFLAMSVVMLAAIIGRFGLNNTLVRFVAAYSAKGEWGKIKGLYTKAMVLSIAVSSGVTLVLYLTAPWVATAIFEKPELATPMRWMSLAILPMVFSVLHGQLLRGLKLVGQNQFISFIIISLVALPVLYLVGNRWGVDGAVWAYISGVSAAAFVGWFLWQRATKQTMRTKGVRASFDLSKLLGSSVPLLTMEVVTFMANWGGIFILGAWGTSAEVGVFSIAFKIAALSGLVLISLNSIAAPKFAALYHDGDIDSLGALAKRSTRLIALMAVPMLLFIFIAPAWIMGIFGDEFRQGALLLSVMAVGQFVNVASGPVGILLIMCGHERAARDSSLLAVTFNIALCLMLIPYYGALGAAIAFSLGVMFKNLLSVFLVKKYLGIRIWSIA